MLNVVKLFLMLLFVSQMTMAQDFVPLKGKIGKSVEWGSGWIDLEQRKNFTAGDSLRLEVGGTAKKILVRILREGQDSNSQVGIISDKNGHIRFELPKKRIIKFKLTNDFAEVKQISVHGGPNPWNIDLGAGNGPATLIHAAWKKAVQTK